MLFSVCIVVLILSVPGLHTTANEKRNSTGIDTIKSDASLTPSILKMVPSLSKQNFRPNADNQTILTFLKKALSTSPKTLKVTIKHKHTIHNASTVKPTSTSDVKIIINKLKTAKDKLTASTNQTDLIKSPAISKSGPTVIQRIQLTTTPSSVPVTAITVAKTATKDKQFTSVYPTTKQTKTTTVSGTTTTTKHKVSVNQTSTKDKPITSVLIKSQTNSYTQANNDKHTASANHTQANKDKNTASLNHTQANKAPVVRAGVKDRERPASSPPIMVASCESSHTLEQEVKLKPGSPLVVTHKISLVPAGCSEVCQAQMEALKARLDRLEKEISAQKEQWNCPNECHGNGEREAGRCVCLEGFRGLDCSMCQPGVHRESKGDKGKVTMKITLDKNTKAEQTISQNKAQTLTLALPEKVSTHLKESVGSRRTVAQVLLKHKGNKQQDNVRGRTILTGQELTPKSEAKQVVMKDGAVAKANSGQLQDQPHTNASLGVMKVTNGTAKLLTIQTKDNTKKSLHPSTMAEKHVTQSSAHTLIKKVKTGSVNASNVVKTVDSTKTATSNIVSGKAVVIKDKQATSANQAISVKGPPSDVKPITEKPDKTVLSSATTQVTGGNTIGKDNQASAVVQITTIKPHDLKPKTVVLTPSKTMTTSGIAVSKDRPTASVNQKTVKTSSDLQPNTDQTILTVVRTTQSRLTKPTSVSGATTITKDNFKASVHRSADAVSTKDNPVEHLQVVVTKSATTNAKLSAKDKPTATANQTAQIKSNSNEKAEKTTISLGSGKAKETQKSQELLSVTSVQKGESSVPQLAGATTQQKHTTRGGGGLGSVKVSNVSSYSFTLTWSAPQGMFKNFTVVRREQRIEAEGAIEQEATTATKNTTASLANAAGSRGKAEEKRVSVVLPGNVRSVEFGHLQANTLYFLQVFGTASGRRSKIHRISRTTGPEPATELVFSNVTESSVTVSWSKLNSSYTGFRVTYTNSITGESHFKTAESQRSHVVLSQLAAGSSYIITVTTTQGEAESDALTSLITTVPAPPVLLRAVNVSDTKALLQWSPGLGAVDGFIISYESAKIPNVTVTVSGSTVEHQLRALQRGTVYTVKALSQKNGLQSPAVCTTFTTASTVKASAVGPRFAVITWRASGVSYQRYRITYHVVGGESKEVILDQTITEYQLTGLLPMTRYMVLVQGERDDQYTSIVTSEFVTGKLRFPWPMDCSEELLNGALQSGEVDIYPNGKKGGAYRVYCDMETDGGGWTVFQRRMNGNTEFYRTWKEYSVGFGNVSQEFWLGNELLHNLTRTRSMGMRVELRAEEDTVYAHYTNFTVDSEEHHYSIMLSGYTGTAGDSMRYHNGRPFSTYDKDPDSLGLHCAKAYMGGWWYKNCYKTNLNGLYNVSSNNQGVVWIDWKGKDSSLPSTEMKIRPAAFSPSAKHG